MLENVSFLAYLFFEGRKILNIAGRNMRKEKVEVHQQCSFSAISVL